MSTPTGTPTAAAHALTVLACIVLATAAGACDSPAGPGAPDPGPTPGNPAPPAVRPAIASLSPDTTSAGGDSVTLTVRGTGFARGAAVLWNGSTRPTTFVNELQLTATVAPADLADAGVAQVTVVGPGPDTLVSGAMPFRVRPRLDSLGVTRLYATGSGYVFSAMLYGAGFDSTTKFEVSGVRRSAAVISPSRMVVSFGARQVEAPRMLEATVLDSLAGRSAAIVLPVLPMPAAPAITSIDTLDLVVSDLAYSPRSGRIYASIPGRAGARGNSLTVIDPATGRLLTSVAVGSEPGKLAVSGDGRLVYVALDGEAALRTFDVDTGILGEKFPIGPAGYTVEDMVVIPGSPNSVVVSRKVNSTFRHRGVAVYDRGVQRPLVSYTGANHLEPGESPAVMYGSGDEHTGVLYTGLLRLKITPEGVSAEEFGAPLGLPPTDFSYGSGKLISTGGVHMDAATGHPLSYLGGGNRAVVADAALDRMFMLGNFSLLTLTLSGGQFLGGVNLTAIDPRAGSLIRWGPDGLAYRLPDRTVILRLNLAPD